MFSQYAHIILLYSFISIGTQKAESWPKTHEWEGHGLEAHKSKTRSRAVDMGRREQPERRAKARKDEAGTVVQDLRAKSCTGARDSPLNEYGGLPVRYMAVLGGMETRNLALNAIRASRVRALRPSDCGQQGQSPKAE